LKHLYGTYTREQIAQTKKSLRGSIFLLLLCVDINTREQYKDVDVNKFFESLQLKIGGMNELLLEQPQLVTVASLLQAAQQEYNSENFEFRVYRKLILDAGSEVERLKEVD